MGDEQAGAIETVLAQIAAAQGSNPGAFSSDALTQAILDRLKEEVAKVYAEAGGEAPDGGGGGAASASPRGSTVRARSAPAVGPLAEGPWMHSLWKASHEVEQPKAKVRGFGWEIRAGRAREPDCGAEGCLRGVPLPRTFSACRPPSTPPSPPPLLPLNTPHTASSPQADHKAL